MNQSKSRTLPTPAQLRVLKDQQNHAVLRESVTDEAILKSGQLRVREGTRQEVRIKKLQQIRDIDNLVKTHPIKKLHSGRFRTELCDNIDNPIYLNPYLVGITYLRRLSAGALPAENGQIGCIVLNQNMNTIIQIISTKEWNQKLTGTIFTADDNKELNQIIERLCNHGAVQIGTEVYSDDRKHHACWAHVSRGSLTFAISYARYNNLAHNYASRTHLYAITGYLHRVRFTITARNYSDLRWITSCVVNKLEQIIKKKKVIIILDKVKAARINSILHYLAGSLARGDFTHECYTKFGKHIFLITSKVDDVSVRLQHEPDVAPMEKEVLKTLYKKYDFVIALPGQLIIDNSIKNYLECMTVPFNEKLAKQWNVPDEVKWQHTNIEIYRRVGWFVPDNSKNNLFEFGRQVCSALDRHSKAERIDVENRVNADEEIPEK